MMTDSTRSLPIAYTTHPFPKWVPLAVAILYIVAIVIYYGRYSAEGSETYHSFYGIKMFIAVIGLFAMTALAYYFTRARFAFQLTAQGIQTAKNAPVVPWQDIRDIRTGTYPLQKSVIVLLNDNDRYIKQLKPMEQYQGKSFIDKFGSPVILSTFRTGLQPETVISWVNHYKNTPPADAPSATGFARYGKDYIPERDDQ